MKINKKFILSLLLPAMFISITKLASADTFQVTFTDPSELSSSVSLTLQYGLNKNAYEAGESLYPTVYVNPKADIRCANGATHSQTLYMYLYNLEIGKPDKNNYLYLKQMNSSPLFYMDSSGTNLYLNDKVVFNAYNTYSVNITEPYTGKSIKNLQINKIESARIDSQGNILGTFDYAGEVSSDYSYSSGSQYRTVSGTAYDELLVTASEALSIAGSYSKGLEAETYIPKLVTVNTYQRPILTGTHVYGNATIPSLIAIPQNAEIGEYVAQLKFRPSYTSYTPSTGSVNTGTWNISAPKPSEPTPTEPTPTYKTCPDGSRILSTQTCPSVTYKTCLDGTRIPSTQTCYKTCPDGSSIPETQTCPKVLREICPNGTSVPIGSECPMLYMFESKNNLVFNDVLEFLGIKKASARAIDAEMIMMNGGGGGGGGSSTYTPPPDTCGTSWWCKISFYEIPLSQSFEIISSNTSPSVLIN